MKTLDQQKTFDTFLFEVDLVRIVVLRATFEPRPEPGKKPVRTQLAYGISQKKS